MDQTTHQASGWKHRLREEFISYAITFVYLAAFFAVFAWHRRLILDEQNVATGDYFVPVLEAAILAKVVLILDLLRVGRRFEDRPLILPTLYKTFWFSIGIAVFELAEETVRGLIHHQGLRGGIDHIASRGWDEVLARCLMLCCALVPFFAFRETGRVLGRGRLTALFWKSSGVSATLK